MIQVHKANYHIFFSCRWFFKWLQARAQGFRRRGFSFYTIETHLLMGTQGSVKIVFTNFWLRWYLRFCGRKHVHLILDGEIDKKLIDVTSIGISQ
jgi:hypothetical protein